MVFKLFTCPACNKTSKAGEWDMRTRVLCKTDKQKKMYRKIQAARGTDRWYVCPCCNEAIVVSKIRGKLLHDTEVV